jgi:hypothetical protein
MRRNALRVLGVGVVLLIGGATCAPAPAYGTEQSGVPPQVCFEDYTIPAVEEVSHQESRYAKFTRTREATRQNKNVSWGPWSDWSGWTAWGTLYQNGAWVQGDTIVIEGPAPHGSGEAANGKLKWERQYRYQRIETKTVIDVVGVPETTGQREVECPTQSSTTTTLPPAQPLVTVECMSTGPDYASWAVFNRGEITVSVSVRDDLGTQSATLAPGESLLHINYNGTSLSVDVKWDGGATTVTGAGQCTYTEVPVTQPPPPVTTAPPVTTQPPTPTTVPQATVPPVTTERRVLAYTGVDNNQILAIGFALIALGLAMTVFVKVRRGAN